MKYIKKDGRTTVVAFSKYLNRRTMAWVYKGPFVQALRLRYRETIQAVRSTDSTYPHIIADNFNIFFYFYIQVALLNSL